MMKEAITLGQKESWQSVATSKISTTFGLVIANSKTNPAGSSIGTCLA